MVILDNFTITRLPPETNITCLAIASLQPFLFMSSTDTLLECTYKSKTIASSPFPRTLRSLIYASKPRE